MIFYGFPPNQKFNKIHKMFIKTIHKIFICFFVKNIIIFMHVFYDVSTICRESLNNHKFYEIFMFF